MGAALTLIQKLAVELSLAALQLSTPTMWPRRTFSAGVALVCRRAQLSQLNTSCAATLGYVA
eukprot:5823141-Karenia_brevis.AAC.1